MYRILFPVDVEADRADRGVDALLAMPGRDEMTIDVLSVFEEFTAFDDGSGAMSSEQLYDPSEIPEAVETVRDRLAENDFAVEVHREHGKPAEEILAAVEDLDIDQVFMAGRKRTPVGKVLFGSVTQAVVLGADVPVTVV